MRWVALSNEKGDGLLIVSKDIKKGIRISALHMPNVVFDISETLDYGDAAKKEIEHRIDGVPELNKRKHTIDIKEQDLVQLNIDLEQLGVTGNNGWGAKPEQKYLVRGDVTHGYIYYLLPFAKVLRKNLLSLVNIFLILKAINTR